MVINMSEYKNVPKIRFKGFTDDWEQRKLEEISNRFDNLRVPVSANDREKGTTPYYGANGIQDYVKGFTHNGEFVLIAEDGANDLKNYPVKYVNGLFWANNHVHVVQGKEGICDNKYLKYCFTKTNIESLLVGGGRAKLNANIMMGIDLEIPSLNEQIKLGRMFSEIDNLITLHQRKCDALMNVKKSLLEKMFPKNSSNIPEIRFKGFTDVWEQRKLGEIGNTFTGLSGKTKEDFGHGEAKFVTYMNVFSNPIAQLNKTEPIEIDNKQNQVEYGDVFFTTSSETPDEVGMSSVWLENKGNIYLNSFCFGFRPFVKNDPYYMAYMLRANRFRKSMTLLAQGISRYNISKIGVMNIDIQLPNNQEQERIGKLFSEIDNLITLHQRKLEKLNNIKKSMLDKMFV